MSEADRIVAQLMACNTEREAAAVIRPVRMARRVYGAANAAWLLANKWLVLHDSKGHTEAMGDAVKLMEGLRDAANEIERAIESGGVRAVSQG